MKKPGYDPLEFQKRLKAWYRTNHRQLPWRQTNDPYKIWISEVMLQQTTVQTVIPYYMNWMKLFPDMRSLAEAPIQAVLKAWQGLGYYQRAKNVHAASKIILNHFEGQIPKKYDDLKSLPGFGPYTSAAVLSIAFDEPHFAIDANIRRILMRLLKRADKASQKIDRELLCSVSPFLPRENMGIFNQAMMELGALICRPRNPLCRTCPVSSFCSAFEAGEQEVIPLSRKRNYQKIEAAVGLVEKQGKFLIQRRPSKGLLADLWEFPGGKIQKGESPKQALRREIMEEIGEEVSQEKLLTIVRHAYTQFQVTLYAFTCSLKNKPKLDKRRQRWVSLKGMQRYPFPSGSAKIIQFLERRLKKNKNDFE